MKKMYIGLLALAAICIIVIFKIVFHTEPTEPAAPRDQPIKVGSHTAAFNSSIDSALNNYFTLTEALVNSDSVAARPAGENLLKSFSAIPLAELKKDTSSKADAALVYSTDSLYLETTKVSVDSLINDGNLAKMRNDFSALSEHLHDLLNGINYSGENLYWQNCPMAFGDDNGANWISNTTTIRNPYLGKKMLSCGEVKDTIKAK